ncbi:hypothetical protein IG631_11077 [Alternaria alternata]|nr:hypothetical protein IG631_11077 [Alternaria alternata]
MSLSKHTKCDLQNLLTTCVRIDGQSSPVCAAWPPRYFVGIASATIRRLPSLVSDRLTPSLITQTKPVLRYFSPHFCRSL